MDLRRWITHLRPFRFRGTRTRQRSRRRLERELCPSFRVTELEDRRVLDATVSLNVSAATVAEDAGTSLVYTFSRSGSPNGDLTVFFSVDGTAGLSADYSVSGAASFNAASGSILIPDGSKSAELKVAPVADTVVERDETVRLTIAPNAAYTVGSDDSATSTILNDDSATLRIDDASISEGNAGTNTLSFTATLTGVLDRNITAGYSTGTNTATVVDGDFLATSGVLTFAGNTASPQLRTVSVTINGDTRVELNETFFVNLTEDNFHGLNVTFARAQAIGTINNDDAAQVSITAGSTTEGNTGTANLPFVVQLSNPVDVDVTLSFNTADGTASTVSPADYQGQTNASVEIKAGTTQLTLQVVINGDLIVEPSETVVGTLSNLSADGRNVVLVGASSTGTILNDDSSVVSIEGGTVAEGASGNSPSLAFTLRLTNPVSVPVLVDFSTTDGTAVAPIDYLSQTASTITIPANTQQFQVSVTVVGDIIVERNETLTGTIANLRGGGPSVAFGVTSAQGTVVNDDSAQISLSSGAVNEGTAPAGTTNLPFRITLTNPVDVPVPVRVSFEDDTATSPSDYVSQAPLEISIPAGTVFLEQNVQVVRDARVELDETVRGRIALVSDEGRSVTLGTDSASGRIVNDDQAPIEFYGPASNDTEDSGRNLPLLLVRGELDVPQTVRIVQAAGTAVNGEDFTLIADVVIVPGSYDGTVLTALTTGLAIVPDTVVERNETLVLQAAPQTPGLVLGDIDGDLVLREQFEYTIINDDRAQLTIANVSAPEAQGQITFQVLLSAAVQGGLSVDIQTADGTALTGDGDFVSGGAPFPSLTFAGTASEIQGFTVLLNDDAKVELDEYFSLSLSNVRPHDASILPSNIDATDTAAGTILNDDQATIGISNLAQLETDNPLTTFVFSITLSAQVDVPVNLLVSTRDGPGTINAQDYQPLLNQSVVFPAATFSGPQTQTVTVVVNGDNLAEVNEIFEVSLHGLQASGREVALAAIDFGTGEIINDDYAPVTNLDSVLLLEDTFIVRSNVDGILWNVTDQDDPDPSTWTIIVVSNPVHGFLNLASDGAYVYQPGPDFFGSDTLAYRVSDGTNSSLLFVANNLLDLPATLLFNVEPVNDPPSFAPPANLLADPLNASVIVMIDQVRPGPANESYQFAPPARAPRWEFRTDNPAIDTASWQIDFASRDPATGWESWVLTMVNLPFENTSAAVTLVFDDGGLGPAGAPIPGPSTFSLSFRLDVVVSGIPGGDLPGIAVPELIVPPALPPAVLPLARTVQQITGPPADPNYVTNEPTAQLDRYVEVRIITPSDDRGGVKETTVLRLPVQSLQDLTSLWPALPDDRYRIYLIVRADRNRVLEERLVLETAIRDGVPTELEDLPTDTQMREPTAAPAGPADAASTSRPAAEGSELDAPQAPQALPGDSGAMAPSLTPALAATVVSPLVWQEGIREAVATHSHRLRTRVSRLLSPPARPPRRRRIP